MNATQTVTVEEVINPQDLLDYTKPRINRRQSRRTVKDLRLELRRAKARYAGGTPAEQQSLSALKDSTRLRCRQAMLSSHGRAIDLLGLLSQRRQDGQPLWALVNPLHEIGARGSYDPSQCQNGGYALAVPADGRQNGRPTGYSVMEMGKSYRSVITVPVDLGIEVEHCLLPGGLPALPAKARRIIGNPKIQRRALWMGVLYQPETWQQRNPDPAVVVEWRDLPGKYFALIVWGGDYHRIMEFVD